MRALRAPEARRREVRHRARLRQSDASSRTWCAASPRGSPPTRASTASRRGRELRVDPQPLGLRAHRARALTSRGCSPPVAPVRRSFPPFRSSSATACAARAVAPRMTRPHSRATSMPFAALKIPLRRVRRPRARVAVRGRAARRARVRPLALRANGGWRWLVGIVARHDARGVDRVAAAVEHVVRSRRRSCSTSLVLVAAVVGAVAWFGYRKFHEPDLPLRDRRPSLLALCGALRRRHAVAGAGQGRRSVRRGCSTARSCATSSPRALVFGVPVRARHRADRERCATASIAALTAHLEAEARQSELSRQLAESKLKLLQLQIEPHFLFNTLGSAQQLAEKGAPEAARLIARPDPCSCARRRRRCATRRRRCSRRRRWSAPTSRS